MSSTVSLTIEASEQVEAPYRWPTKRNGDAPVAQFRARPWPVAVGSEADLRAKREANSVSMHNIPHWHSSLPKMPRPFLQEDPELGFHDPVHDFEGLLERLEKYITMRPGVNCTFDLFAQESWRSQMWSSCHTPVDKDQLMNAEADVAFADLKERMSSFDHPVGWRVGEDTYAAVRQMVMWLMEHDLDGLRFLIREGPLHVGNDLFPPCTQEWHSHFVGEAESLLSLASKNLCSPAAVQMLLDHGADPNGELAPRSFNGGYLPTCGPGALACLDVCGEWTNKTDDKLAILTALANAGGEMCNAWSEYQSDKEAHKAEFDLCSKLYYAEIQRTQADARQRLETVVALVGIVSFWRSVAAAPDSKAAKAAIARAAKRARAWADERRANAPSLPRDTRHTCA